MIDTERRSAQLKANIALQALGGTPISRLADKHNIPEDEIREWTQILQNRANSLFEFQTSPESTTAHPLGSEVLESITDNVREGILRSNPDDGLLYVNRAFIDMFGYSSAEEVLATHPDNFYAHPEKRLQLIELMKKEGHIQNEEVLFRRKDGSTFWGLETTTQVCDDNDNIYFDAVINDISKRKASEKLIREIAQGISSATGHSFFKTLVKYISRALDVDFVWVGDFQKSPAPQTIACRQDNQMFPDFELNLDGLPWKTSSKEVKRIYAQGAYRHFPQNSFMANQKFEFMAGTSLANSQGRLTGLLLVMNRRPIQNYHLVEPIIQIFGDRAAAELERKHSDEQLHQSLHEKEVLISEIHHRVKNNLAVVTSLLSLQAEQADNDYTRELFKESESRILSMAVIHEMLYQHESLSNIPFNSFIQEIVDTINSYFRDDKTQVDTFIRCDDIYLNIDQAVPCALIMNELLTNAYKYAFEGMDSGEIRISIEQVRDKRKLTIEDNGVGLPEDIDPKAGEELGFTLVKTLTTQLHGELNVVRNNGTRFEITFP